jgi:hypothetical protein
LSARSNSKVSQREIIHMALALIDILFDFIRGQQSLRLLVRIAPGIQFDLHFVCFHFPADCLLARLGPGMVLGAARGGRRLTVRRQGLRTKRFPGAGEGGRPAHFRNIGGVAAGRATHFWSPLGVAAGTAAHVWSTLGVAAGRAAHVWSTFGALWVWRRGGPRTPEHFWSTC